MPFYEMVYEDGSNGIACAEDDEEMLRGVTEAHRRAMAGEPAIAPAEGEATQRAVRIVKVLKYDKHPVDLYENQTAPADEVLARVKETLGAMGDVVSIHEVAADIRNMSDPHAVKEAPHDSLYKMDAAATLAPKDWGGE